MRYSFDPLQQVSNLKKHGLDLEQARQVIESGETLTFEDRRFAYEENASSPSACCTGSWS